MNQAAPTIEETLRLRHALENVFVCGSLRQAQRLARIALQEVTVSEAAERLGVSRQHVHILIRQGQLQSRRAGRLRLISESEVSRMQHEASQRVSERPKPSSLKTCAIMECARWLSFCLEIGWPKTELDELESLWWRCRGASAGEPQ